MRACATIWRGSPRASRVEGQGLDGEGEAIEGPREPPDPDLLLKPIVEIRGIGERVRNRLSKLDIERVGDLIHHFPVRYEDLRLREPLDQLADGEKRSIFGEVISGPDFISSGSDRWEATLAVEGDSSERVKLVWFSRSRWRPRLEIGWKGFVTGSIRRFRGIQIAHPELGRCDTPQSAPPGHDRLVAIYPSTEGIQQGNLRRWIAEILTDPRLRFDAVSERFFPGRELIQLYRGLHTPETLAEQAVARSLVARLELALHALRQQRQRRKRMALTVEAIGVPQAVDARIRARFSFSLTDAQERAVADVTGDLARGYPMARLIQGDVGCGKTAIAIYALLAVVAAGRQGALLAPTGALAEQHRDSLDRLLAGSRVKVNLQLGGQDGGDRESIASGEAAIIVGTHALLRPDLVFRDLALVVVDEEQRFGVSQRALLAAKGERVHRLHLSATPIPRSLALALCGEFDLSVIDERPPGRRPVRTHEVERDKLKDGHRFLLDEVGRGNRVMFVVPRIEETEDEGAVSVEELARDLGQGLLGEVPIGTLHGRKSVDERHETMARFRDGRCPVLVATSVVEVGLDVPELTVVWIESAELFGLSQLHQLRGRVGRSERTSWCFFTADPQTEVARDRLAAFKAIDDGFQLAESDLALRGAGDEIGSRQSGSASFRLVHPLEDLGQFEQLRRLTAGLLEQPPGEKEDLDLLERLEPFLGPGA